jgi:aspartate/methionine/tyrosine aminotransferase
MIVINNPNNPTGSTIPKAVLQEVVDFAKERGIIVLCDEVYSPLYHNLPSGTGAPPSILTLGYEKTVATGSLSKAFALAGIRVGWVASRSKEILEAINDARDYTTISVSHLDDQVAAYALSTKVFPSLIRRNMTLAKTNLDLLDAFIQKHSDICSWVKPTAGTTAWVHFRSQGRAIDDEKFVLDLLDKTKVLFLPATPCFGHGKDFNGYVRIGYACHTAVLEDGLDKLAKYITENFGRE